MAIKNDEVISIELWNDPNPNTNPDIPTEGQCGYDVYWSFDESTGTLTVTGSGSMWDFDDMDTRGYLPCRDTTRHLIIENGVTEIGDSAFAGFYALRDVSIPDGITRIGSLAFANCVLLQELILPESLEEIGDGAFCMAGYFLKELVIPRACNSIGSEALVLPGIETLRIENPYISKEVLTDAFPIDGGRTIYATEKEEYQDLVSFANSFEYEEDILGNCIDFFSEGVSQGDDLIELSYKPVWALWNELLSTDWHSYDDYLEGMQPLADLYLCEDGEILAYFKYGNADYESVWEELEALCTSGYVTESSCPTVYSYAGTDVEDFANENSLPFVCVHEFENAVCIYCGENETGAHIHTLIKIEAVPATCTTPGNTAYWTCTDPECGKCFSDANGENESAENSWVVEKNPTNHSDYGTKIVNAKAATCTIDGYTGDTVCKSCGAVFNSGTVIPAQHGLINGFDEDSATATCKNPGFYMKTCLDCNAVVESQTYAKDPNNHADFGTEVKNSKSATCKEDGYTGDKVCKGCGAVLEAGAAVAKNTVAHTWNSGAITKAATCKETGVKTFTCSICEATRTEPVAIDSTNHANYGTEINNSKSATCKEDGYSGDKVCKGCGAVLEAGTAISKDTVAHTWGDWVVKTEATYLFEGSKMRKCQYCSKEETASIAKLIPNQCIENNETGTKVEYQDNTVPQNTQVIVDEEYDGTSFKLLNNEKGNFQKVMFNITLESNGVKVQPNGYVLVRIPIPAGFSTSNLHIYYVSGDDNRFEEIPCYVENGFVCFETTHFSDYAIVDESKTVTSDKPVQTGKVCKYCGEVHNGFFQKIIGFFHSILALFGLHK